MLYEYLLCVIICVLFSKTKACTDGNLVFRPRKIGKFFRPKREKQKFLVLNSEISDSKNFRPNENFSDQMKNWHLCKPCQPGQQDETTQYSKQFTLSQISINILNHQICYKYLNCIDIAFWSEIWSWFFCMCQVSLKKKFTWYLLNEF